MVRSRPVGTAWRRRPDLAWHAGGCYFLGGFGRLYEPVINEATGKIAFDSIIPAMLVTLPDALIALVVLLVLSASMSTLASLVLTSSSTMTLDLIYRDKKSLPGEVEEGSIDDVVAEKVERRKVVVMRVLIVFFIVISLLIALNPPTFIAQLMGISWGALAGAFLAPFMLGLYWKGVTKSAVWACFIWGVGLTVVNMLMGNPINPINCGALAMIGGFPVVWKKLTPSLHPKASPKSSPKVSPFRGRFRGGFFRMTYPTPYPSQASPKSSPKGKDFLCHVHRRWQRPHH